ncbi:MAG TPA: monovalent cation/H+ antiporter complex subunit F [Anaerolineaceae bacterium]|jgi:multicomponent Na+:H+ antiporter subunit F|nr:monovalent cation/H+ antiporter complex subunit F [Anaerolineaceae bacterium]HOH19632.1 monovalent cation/H+ antiporter complex subunit F [Anaerolineaceae bacterium]HOU45320.1 monovalent cation/H+ antiporter complex subunit F [Anaerolineaceae bacterium]HQF46775.1 monovalent cation/H+ antiporter complex subunit F [Anaerolineaceae bacterium]HQH36653.1 monovalent cation/H+ antiporter complex subunit F [Anaerolineaceae bacterium]
MNTVILFVILGMLAAAMVIAFIRLARGPRLPDRVVALDLISVIVMAFICVYAVRFNQPNFLDVAIIMALLTFLGTVAFAFYIERRA